MAVDTRAETHTITALVQDKPGVLTRVSGLFRRRGFNISNLAVGHSEVQGLSRMTFAVEGDDYVVEQVTKQLYKLIDVVRVHDISQESIVARELALIKVRTTPQTRAEVLEIVDIFRAHVVDVGAGVVIVEITGDEEKVNALIQLMKPFGIREIMRTGSVAMSRGAPATGSRKRTLENVDQSAPDAEVVP